MMVGIKPRARWRLQWIIDGRRKRGEEMNGENDGEDSGGWSDCKENRGWISISGEIYSGEVSTFSSLRQLLFIHMSQPLRLVLQCKFLLIKKIKIVIVLVFFFVNV
jgi:hypothetical protein